MFGDKAKVDDLLKKIEQEPYLKCLTIDQLFFVLLDEKIVSFKDLSEAYFISSLRIRNIPEIVFNLDK